MTSSIPTPQDELVEIVRPVLIQARERFCPERTLRVGVGVSGGEDSIALMNILDLMRGEGLLDFVVLHFNHKLRPESNEEEKFVRRAAELMNAEFVSASPGTLWNRSTNVEAWARDNRYAFFESCRAEGKLDAIATAHHLKDRAETLLFRLITGRLATSSIVMKPIDTNRRVVRPFLYAKKELIQAYLHYAKLPYVTDSSNFDLERSRNWIRHRLFPELESELNPSLTQTLDEVASRLLEDEEFLNAQAQEIAKHSNLSQDIVTLPPSLGWRVLRELCAEQLGEHAHTLGYRSLRSAFSELSSTSTIGKDLGRGIRILTERGRIYFVDGCPKVETGAR